MIFVTIGNEETYGFYRLIKNVDEIASELGEKVIMQIGCTKYVPKNTIYFKYIPYDKFIEYFQAADIVISHCSSGAIINTRKFNKQLIAVPRRKIYGELIDEHQLELSRAIENEPNITVVCNISDLREAVLRILSRKNRNILLWDKPRKVSETIRKFIDNLGMVI